MFPPGLGGTPARPAPRHYDARPRRRWPLVALLVAMAGAATGLVLSQRVGSSTGASVTTTNAPTSSTTTTTVPASTTTSVPAAVPPSPQASADDAARGLVGAWANGNRPAALTVATTDAVNTLFGVPYPPGLAGDRGCGAGASPVVCTFGPPGGGNPNDPIYSLTVTQTPAGTWYVSSVRIQG
jgi:hypothetical protein